MGFTRKKIIIYKTQKKVILVKSVNVEKRLYFDFQGEFDFFIIKYIQLTLIQFLTSHSII